MIIEHLKDGPYVDAALNGSNLSIAGLLLDLSERQDDAQVIIDIVQENGNIVEGVGRSGVYVANILLPPKQYEVVETDETGFDGRKVIAHRALPLDIDRVVLKLWQMKAEESNQGETI
jgi:hypothetical protein